MGRIKAIIFDLDRTLIYTKMLYVRELLYKTLSNFGLGDRLDRIKLSRFWFSHNKNGVIVEGFGVENIRRFWRVFNRLDSVEARLENSYVYSDVSSLVDLGLKFGIVASGRDVIARAEARLVREKLEVDSLVVVHDYKDRGNYNLMVDGLVRCMEELEVDLSKVAYVGDTKSDLMAARRLNMSIILLRRGGNIDDYSNYVIKSLRDLPELLK